MFHIHLLRRQQSSGAAAMQINQSPFPTTSYKTPSPHTNKLTAALLQQLHRWPHGRPKPFSKPSKQNPRSNNPLEQWGACRKNPPPPHCTCNPINPCSGRAWPTTPAQHLQQGPGGCVQHLQGLTLSLPTSQRTAQHAKTLTGPDSAQRPPSLRRHHAPTQHQGGAQGSSSELSMRPYAVSAITQPC